MKIGHYPALVVIDMQRWFLETGTADKKEKVPQLVAGVNVLIDSFTAENLPIVRVVTEHRQDRSTWDLWMKEYNEGHLTEGTWEAEEVETLITSDQHTLVRKTRHSAFIKTELEQVLRSNSIDTVVICGYATNACVGLTAIEAYERDFRVVLSGGAILGNEPSKARHMLDYLKSAFLIEPTSNSEILKQLAENSRGKQ